MAEVVSNREVIDHDAAAAHQQRQGGALDTAEPMQAAETNACGASPRSNATSPVAATWP